MSANFNPELRTYFEMLPIDIKNEISESGAEIKDLGDLLNIVNSYLYNGTII